LLVSRTQPAPSGGPRRSRPPVSRLQRRDSSANRGRAKRSRRDALVAGPTGLEGAGLRPFPKEYRGFPSNCSCFCPRSPHGASRSSTP
jgi:hypothetical protein